MSPVVISVEAVALSASNRWLWLILPFFEKSVRWRWVEWFGRWASRKFQFTSGDGEVHRSENFCNNPPKFEEFEVEKPFRF